MNTKIENATLQDIPKLNEISLESKAFWGYPEDWLNSWEDELTINQTHIENHQTFKLVHEDCTIGFCVIEQHGDECHISHMWVIPKYIGWGFGKVLLEESIKRGVHSPCKIMVESDPNAEGFYKKYGFHTIDQVESYPKGRYLPVMEKVLN